MSNINAVFQVFFCPNCDTFSNRTINLERHLTTCTERIKNVYPSNVYQLRDTLFDKLDSFGKNYTTHQKLFKDFSRFNFESFLVQEKTFNETKTTNWIGKHVPISVTNSSNLVEEPTFLCNSDPHHFVGSFVGCFEDLALWRKTRMKFLFLDIETILKIKLGSVWRKLTQHHNRTEQASSDDCDNKSCASTQFLQFQTILQRFTSVMFQQCKKGSQFNQILFATRSF